MRDRLDELGEATDVVLITFTQRAHLVDYLTVNELPYTILIDDDRRAYRAFGLGRGSVRRVWGLRSLRRYVELFRKNGLRGLARPTEDTLQLGGDFVIGPDGTLVWGYWGEGPDDRPSVDKLIDAVSAAR